jgi:hypothetical protein
VQAAAEAVMPQSILLLQVQLHIPMQSELAEAVEPAVALVVQAEARHLLLAQLL